MQRITIVAAAGVILALGVTAVPGQDSERYQLEPSGDGYIRLDRETGEVSYCEQQSGSIVCRVAADERDALIDEIARLQDTLRSLDDRVTALETGKAPPQTALPSEEEFDRTLGYMERFLRRFMGIVKELDRDVDPPVPGAPQRS